MSGGLHVTHSLFLSDFDETWVFFSMDFRQILKYQISRKSIKLEPSCPIRTDRQDEANSRFSQFCERAHKLFP